MSALPPLPKVRNPRTHAVIRRETLWQVAMPLAVTGLVVVGVMVVIGLGAAGVLVVPTRPLADISLMFLILIVGGASLINLLVLLALVFGFGYLLRELPFWAKRLQDFTWRVALQIKSMTHQVDQRVVGVHLSLAALRSIGASFRALFAPWRSK